MIDTDGIRRQLQEVEARIAEKQAENQRHLSKSLGPLEGERDRLLNRLLDTEGADSRRPVAVR